MGVIKPVLNAMGLGSAAEAAGWRSRAEKLEGRCGDLQAQVKAARDREDTLKQDLRAREQQLEKSRGEVQRLEREHARAADRAEQMAALKAELGKAKAAADRAEAENAALRAQAAELESRLAEGRAKQDHLAAEVAEQRARADKGHHAARLAREHLMAIEVKLDLIEAAIGVLDTRTRGAGVPS